MTHNAASISDFVINAKITCVMCYTCVQYTGSTECTSQPTHESIYFNDASTEHSTEISQVSDLKFVMNFNLNTVIYGLILTMQVADSCSICQLKVLAGGSEVYERPAVCSNRVQHTQAESSTLS